MSILPMRVLSLFLLLPTLACFPTLAHSQGLPPKEAESRMKLPPGFTARVVAHEPMIRQPLSISFDERGRLWVLQFLQYPSPAGLKPVKQDQYLRTIWDKVPLPPPKGDKGLDRITICYDPDENGVFRTSKDFVTGLNMASGFCLGNGGVYVAQPPYLLFFPDRDHDDVPDGDPEVLLTGFGLDDTHSLANSLQWGPDGWLYGAAGSTSTSRIEVDLAGIAVTAGRPSVGKTRIIEFQQGIWRYHPKTRIFELFSEGGGNTYGLDFDRHGHCIAGTNYGGKAMLHHFPGAYYVKGFSKHGPLHNPYAYGYFEHVPYKNFKGGHVTCGGVLYEADVYPKEYHHQYIAGNLLSNAVYWHRMTPAGASFTAEHGGELMETDDTWFRPVDLMLGPDGCIYVADWYDKRAAHLDPIDNWDKTNGRVYRIEYNGAKYPSFDLRKKSGPELVELLKHPNIWWRREARRMLLEKGADAASVETLRKWVKEGNGTLPLEALWTLYGLGKLDVATEDHLLQDSDVYLRMWGVRFLEDFNLTKHKQLANRLYQLAETDASAHVLVQLAASIRRCNNTAGVTALNQLIRRTQPLPDDPALPLMLWWAIEEWSNQFSEDKSLFRDLIRTAESRPEFRFALERLARKVAATQETGFAHILVSPEQHPKCYDAVIRGLDQGLTANPDDIFRTTILNLIPNQKRIDPATQRLLIRLGDLKERQTAIERLKSPDLPDKARIDAMQILTMVKSKDLQASLPGYIATSRSDTFTTACIAALESFDDPKSSELLLSRYPAWSAAVKKRALQALLSRPAWALELFQAYDAGKFPKADLTLDHARIAAAHPDNALAALVEKHFGKIGPATAGEKQARIAALNLNLGRAKTPGDPARGKVIFTKTCAACHQLHGEGTKVGPDLTTADRKNRVYLLTHIVDPSLYIRTEFLSYKLNTIDGRTFTGMVLEQNAMAVTLASYVNGKVEKTVIDRKDIDTFDAIPISIMPEKQLDAMTDDEIKDLFAYLQGDPLKKPDDRKAPVPGEPGSLPLPGSHTYTGETKVLPGTLELTPEVQAPGTPQVKKYKIALISGSLEYESDKSLAGLQKLLEEKFPVECVRMFRKTDTDIPGLEKLAEVDLAIFFTRRLKPSDEQLAAVKTYIESGKPVLGIRTASHGFQNWLEMDKEILGGNYTGHFGHKLKCDVLIEEKNKDHEILKGVKPFATTGGLYKNQNIAKDTTVLLNGKNPTNTEPVAWTRERKVNNQTQRIFYTSLGFQDDFKDPNFTRLLTNAIGWCLKDRQSFEK